MVLITNCMVFFHFCEAHTDLEIYCWQTMVKQPSCSLTGGQVLVIIARHLNTTKMG